MLLAQHANHMVTHLALLDICLAPIDLTTDVQSNNRLNIRSTITHYTSFVTHDEQPFTQAR